MDLRAWIVTPWDQARAVDNARTASAALHRARVEREEVHAFIESELRRRSAVVPRRSEVTDASRAG